jgi:predicted dehydrogenase
MSSKSNNGTFRIAVVGAGGRQAREHRTPSLRCLPGVEVAAFVDVFPGAAEQARNAFYHPGTIAELRAVGYPLVVDRSVPAPRAYNSLAAAIDAERLDGVMIVTPHALHKAGALEAAAAGLHVFTDKPTAASPEEAIEMADAIAAAGVIGTVGYQNAFAIEWLLGQMATSAFGTLTGGLAYWTRTHGMPDAEHFWAAREAGIVPDLSGHLVTPIVVAIAGRDRIVGVKARGSNEAGVARFGHKFVADDTVIAELHLQSGAIIELVVSWANGKAPKEWAGINLYGTNDARIENPFVPMKDIGYVPDLDAFLPVRRAEGHGTLVGPKPPTYPELMIAQAGNFVRAAQGTEELAFSIAQAVTVELVVGALQRSADLGDVYVAIA